MDIAPSEFFYLNLKKYCPYLGLWKTTAVIFYNCAEVWQFSNFSKLTFKHDASILPHVNF